MDRIAARWWWASSRYPAQLAPRGVTGIVAWLLAIDSGIQVLALGVPLMLTALPLYLLHSRARAPAA